MRPTSRLGALLVASIVLLTACGGAATATQSPVAAPAASASPGAAGATPSKATPETAATTDEPGASVTIDESAPPACPLISAAEVAGVMGTADVTTEEVTLTVNECHYSTAAVPKEIVVTSYSTTMGPYIYPDAGSAGPDAIQVSGIGDKAVYLPGSSLLYIGKGDAVVSIVVITDLTPDRNLELAKKLGAFAAGRM